jgi:hypothetical protein
MMGSSTAGGCASVRRRTKTAQPSKRTRNSRRFSVRSTRSEPTRAGRVRSDSAASGRRCGVPLPQPQPHPLKSHGRSQPTTNCAVERYNPCTFASIAATPIRSRCRMRIQLCAQIVAPAPVPGGRGQGSAARGGGSRICSEGGTELPPRGLERHSVKTCCAFDAMRYRPREVLLRLDTRRNALFTIIYFLHPQPICSCRFWLVQRLSCRAPWPSQLHSSVALRAGQL